MKTKVKILIIGIVVICLAGIYSIIDKNVSLYDIKCDTSEFQMLTLEEGKEVVQSFICKENTLDGMALKLAADDNADRADLILSYRLIEKKSDKEVAKGKTDLINLKSGKFFEIRFSEIDKCMDKEYEFRMSLENGELGSVRVFYTPGKSKSAQLIYAGDKVEGIEVLRTITHRFDMETFIITLCFVGYIVVFMRWLYKLFK